MLGLSLIFLSFYLFFHTAPTPPHTRKDTEHETLKNSLIIHKDIYYATLPPQLATVDSIKLLSILLYIILSLFKLFLNVCSTVRYVSVSTCLSTKSSRNKSHEKLSLNPFYLLHWLMLLENNDSLFYYILSHNMQAPKYRLTHNFKFDLIVTIFPHFLTLAALSTELGSLHDYDFLWIMIFQRHYFNTNPRFLLGLLILLSNDVHKNPGPFQNSYFSFMSWNCNSIAKDDFHRVRLLEVQNSIFNYDLISLCETSLNDSVEIPDDFFDNEYTFIKANKPDNTRHGGVGLFYRNTLPLKNRSDLSFDENLVVELKFGRKNIFFCVLYRSPSFNHSTPEFEEFKSNFTNLYNSIKNEKPYMTFFAGDFNAHSKLWYREGNTTPEGKEFEELIFSLGLTQIINEPTNFEPHKNPSCIDLIITDQPNLVLDSGTRPSPDPVCHHQITYCKANFNLPPSPPYEREFWYYPRANTALIQRSMQSFPWEQRLNINQDRNWQAREFTKIFLNIMSNFIPHETKKIIPRENPWITKPLKAMIKRKDRLYKNYKKNGYQLHDKARLDIFRSECQEAVEGAKKAYMTSLGNKLHDQYSNGKVFWRIVNKVMNKSKAPKVPPLLVNNKFILDCKEKATLFTSFFCKQCTPNLTSSTLPHLTYNTNERLEQIPVTKNNIILLLKKLNPNKATGPDGISSKMLLLCGETVARPLHILFSNILASGTYPKIWKLANITPIHKKSDKQLIQNYRPISLLPICGKILEKLIFNHMYTFLNSNNLITKKQSGFRPGDSTTNQLLDFIDEIHQSFDSNPPLEIRAVFMDISKAFDKVWHEGLIYKLEQNGISGNLLGLFKNYLSYRKQRVVLNG